jgi:hypothetical protein
MTWSRYINHFGEVLPLAVRWLLHLLQTTDIPAETFELLQERFLDVVLLV